MHRWFSASSVLTAVCFINFMTIYVRLLPKEVMKITPIEYTLAVTGDPAPDVGFTPFRPTIVIRECEQTARGAGLHMLG